MAAQALAPLEVQFGPINVQNIGLLRTLNEHTFPVRYADKFYKEIPTLPEEFAQFVYFGGLAIGAVCGRLEPCGDAKKLYIMTIGVLTAYRGRGVGRKLLDYLLGNAAKRPDIRAVYLHVQTSNATGLDFYAKNGFETVGTIHGYYKRIEPPDCYVLGKVIHGDADGAKAADVLGDITGLAPP